ncbi:MAG: hypothetical protein GX591_07770 [Planctomycetes bacterium]|nr:hypothetical protein [Planctomycetota bacterium]
MKTAAHRIVLAALIALSAAASQAAVTVTVDTAATHQTIRGWGAALPWLMDVPDRLAGQIIDVAVNDLGLNGFRYECPAGWSTEATRWEWLNDDDDPCRINWDAFNLPGLDDKMAKWVVPTRNAVEANGERFYLQVSPSFFDGGSSGSIPVWMFRNAGEYAEWAEAVLLRMRDAHGIEADTYTICNEAANNNAFTSAAVVARMIKTLAPRLAAHGLPTRFQFPESINAYAAISAIQSVQHDDELWSLVEVISYHLYGGTDYRDDLWAFASARGIDTAQTEFMENTGNAIDHLYNDLTIANTSQWEVYGMGFPMPDDTRTSFTRSSGFWSFRQAMHYIRPGAVRVEAASSLAGVRPLAFVRDGEVTVLLINTTSGAAQTVTVNGLPAGQYAASRSVNKGVFQELGVRTVGADGRLTLDVPNGAMLTIYPHNGGNLPPEPTSWAASPRFLRLGGGSTVTLSAAAQDSELDPLSYTWSVAEAPAGAFVAVVGNGTTCQATGLTVPGLYVFAVDVSDAAHTVTREVLVNVYDGNQPPVVFAHVRIPVQIFLPTASASLRTHGYDPEGAAVTFQWSTVSHPDGAAPVLATPAAASCAVSGLTVPGRYVFRSTGSDGTDTTSVDLPVTVFPQDVHPPTLTDAQASVAVNGCGLLTATTADADGDWISHWWEVNSGPAGATVRFSNQGRARTVVWTDTPGTYRFALTAVGPNQYATTLLLRTLAASPAPLGGDATLDGTVDLDDFSVLKQNFGLRASWDGADFDGNGTVDLDDFVILKQNFGRTE